MRDEISTMSDHATYMSEEAPPYSAVVGVPEKEIQVPEWDHINAAQASKNARPSLRQRLRQRLRRLGLSAKFDRFMPPHRRYLRMKRRTFLLVILGIVLALIGLLVGFLVGPTRGTNGRPATINGYPLPSDTTIYNGDLTYFDPGLGACGVYSNSSQFVVAVSEILFDAAGSSSSDGGNSNDNPLCGRLLRAERYDDKLSQLISMTLKVVDRCTACKVDDLDTTLTAFNYVADQALGRVTVQWAWL